MESDIDSITNRIDNIELSDNDLSERYDKLLERYSKLYTEKVKLSNKIDELNEKIHRLEFEFYRQSLVETEKRIEEADKEGKKALKDIIGEEFENHRKRIWEYFGFQVTKKKYGASWNIDWTILYNDKLVAFEEDKGHYLDSTFLDRALSNFCKTSNNFRKNDSTLPKLIIHSFTKYNLFYKKLDEDMETRKDIIKEDVMQNIVYNTLTNSDRIKSWFSKDRYNCYSINVDDNLILDDIKFIKSLIPSG